MKRTIWIVGSLCLLCLGGFVWDYWGDGAWNQEIDATSFYEAKGQRVYRFSSQNDRETFQHAIRWERKSVLEKAKKIKNDNYLGTSQPLPVDLVET